MNPASFEIDMFNMTYQVKFFSRGRHLYTFSTENPLAVAFMINVFAQREGNVSESLLETLVQDIL